MPEPNKFPPQGWQPNQSFAEAILQAARKEVKWYEWRKKLAVIRCLNQADFRFVLESQVTDMLLRAGNIPPSSTVLVSYGDGLCVWNGEWLRELLDIILEYAPQIIELIMTIISLFAAGVTTETPEG
jgi:hypothetical protein